MRGFSLRKVFLLSRLIFLDDTKFQEYHGCGHLKLYTSIIHQLNYNSFQMSLCLLGKVNYLAVILSRQTTVKFVNFLMTKKYLLLYTSICQSFTLKDTELIREFFVTVFVIFLLNLWASTLCDSLYPLMFLLRFYVAKWPCKKMKFISIFSLIKFLVSETKDMFIFLRKWALINLNVSYEIGHIFSISA